MKKLLKRTGICLILASLVWCGTLLADRQRLNEGLIRLHVVANSDSEEDQDVKLLVRDEVIGSLREELSNVADIEQARKYLRQNLPKIQALVNETLRKAGFEESAAVSLCKEAFPTRRYDTFTLPAGVYEALRITIGNGDGHNWWCVVFPSLCLPATTGGFTEAAAEAGFPQSLSGALTGQTECRARFYLLDAIGELENRFFAD